MEILRKRSTTKGAAETFTGDVWVDVIAGGEGSSRIRVNIVRFCPAAHTAWHYHLIGQNAIRDRRRRFGAGARRHRSGDTSR